MDQEKIGKFIYKLRKEKGLTQKDIAEKLNISDNSVSKWERGINIPDISYLPFLADIFNVTVNELLNGEYDYKKKDKNYSKLNKVIAIKDLCKSYGKKQVLNNINLDIYEGEIVGLIGKNGAGKTTLIKSIINFCQIQKGEIKLFNKYISKDYEKIMNKIAVIIENPAFYLNLSGRDNIKIVSLLNNITDQNYIEKIVKELNLAKDLDKKVAKYSLGMKQRLGLVCALIKKPKLLLLDEPTNGLDPIGINELRMVLQKINQKENTTILISSHILSEIENICDRILIIDQGFLEEVDVCKLKHHHKSLESEFLEKVGVTDDNI